MAKKFFYVCAGLFLLVLSYHLGADRASAQAPSNPVVTMSDPWIVTANGDIYQLMSSAGDCVRRGNVFSGAATPAKVESWGSVKVRYR